MPGHVSTRGRPPSCSLRAGEGPTVFDCLVKVLDRQVPGALVLR
ncbi:hypothetical protein [Streptomyces sp. NPDC002580]